MTSDGMSDHLDKLRTTLHELEEELKAVDSLDEDAANLLQEAAKDIQEALHKQDPTLLEHPTLIQRLRDATERFEVSHPTLTGIVTRMIDGLAQMGI